MSKFELKIRPLRFDEVEIRIGTVSAGKGISLLLYKDARCDRAMLDEAVGPMNWQCHYSRDNRNCTVSIWDPDQEQWIAKEDTGTVSNTEAEKGLASDSFKRACFKWGFGAELYEAPFIWLKIPGISKEDARYMKFKVTEMEVADGKISRLVVINQQREVVFSYGQRSKGAVTFEPIATQITSNDAPANPPGQPWDTDEVVEWKLSTIETPDEARRYYIAQAKLGAPQPVLVKIGQRGRMLIEGASQ